jgi:hypothetical protein
VNREEHYTRIWERGDWGTPKSSVWARPEYTETIQIELPRIIERYGIRSMFDAPCGDFTWMRYVVMFEGLAQPAFRYIGGDVVAPMVSALSEQGWQGEFRVHDLLADPFPEVDLWFCRDCLYLYSFEDQASVFRRFLDSSIRFLALTSHFNHINIDQESGPEREVNYLAEPFRFPKPLEQVLDWTYEVDRPGLKPRALYFWRREALEPAMRAFTQGVH